MEETSCYDERYKSRMRWEVVQALLHSLPSGLIESYVMASMAFDSELLTAEADPLLFLQLENNNIPRAAHKLALSWHKRRACFGEMAFLPMGQVGMGALTEQVALGYSCMQQLPNDKQGNAVYIINAPKITRSLSTSGARAMFYQLHLAKAIGGVVFLFLDCGTHRVDEMASFFGLLSELVNDSLPLRAIRVHILSLKSEMPSTMVNSAVELILQKHLTDHVVVTEEVSAQDLAPRLECFGLPKEGLPPFLGGTLGSVVPPPPAAVAAGQLKDATTDDCAAQPPQGIAMNQGGLIHPHTDPAQPPHGSADPQGHTHYYRPFPPPPPLGVAVAHSGSYYPYTGHEHLFSPPPVPSFAIQPPSMTLAMPLPCSIQSLGQQHQDSNNNMIMVNYSQGTARTAAAATSSKKGQGKSDGGLATFADPSRHPYPVAAAAGFPNQQQNETGEVDLTAKRERNAYYSRRKYARKKIEIEVRQEEARRLQEENTAFQQEHERLERLLLQAQTFIDEMHNKNENTGTSDDRPPEETATVAKA